MTNPKIHAEQLPARDYRIIMLDYLLERQKDDPNFTIRLVEEIWKALPPAEQETRYNMTTALYPEDDNKGREKLLSGLILLEHIANEAQLAHELDQEFASDVQTNQGTIT